MDELTQQLVKLRKDVDSLRQEFYKNNFSANQDFTKKSSFITTLKVPHKNLFPLVGEVGEIIEIGGILYICSSKNVFTAV